jgi:hypothetical protein
MVWSKDRQSGAIGPKEFTVDHVVSFAAGGSNALSNLVGAHSLCNQERGQIFSHMLQGRTVSPITLATWKMDDAKTLQYCKSVRDKSIQTALRNGTAPQAHQKPFVQLVRYPVTYNKPVGWLTRFARWAGAI